MFKLYSKGCEHAVRALAYAHIERDGARFQPKEVCKHIGIPEPYTRKILQSLVQAKFLVAHRGPGGGYSLARPAEEISLLDIIKAVDGHDTFDHCIMGLPECGGANPCPIHLLWAESKTKLLDDLDRKTLAEIGAVALRAGPPPQVMKGRKRATR